MSKLPLAHKFIDLSDYGRPVARFIARALKDTAFTPIHLTLGFVILGLIAVTCIIYGYHGAALVFLILKSIVDAADGELSRIKNTPSYTGRYLDSIADIGINFLLFLALWHVTGADIVLAVLAFLGMQLQGTLYNYYYVILRNRRNGDTTSRIFETTAPTAMAGEKQKNVDRLFAVFHALYVGFDRTIYWLDRTAYQATQVPNWLMTFVSVLGLGFQLLVIGVMLVLGWRDFIIPFFIAYSVMILFIIGARKAQAQFAT
jgi:phosphatidylserine synthase